MGFNVNARYFVDDTTAKKLKSFGLEYVGRIGGEGDYSIHGYWLEEMAKSPLVVAVEVDEETRWASVTFKRGISKVRIVKRTFIVDVINNKHEEMVISLEYVPLSDTLDGSSYRRDKRDGYCFSAESGLSIPSVVLGEYLDFINKVNEMRQSIGL